MSGYLRTLRIPVHYLTTKRKLSILDRLTARLTYAVRLFCDEVERSSRYRMNILRRGMTRPEAKTPAGITTLNGAGGHG